MKRLSTHPRSPSSPPHQAGSQALPDYISGREVCRRLHCNPRHVAKLVRLGEIGLRCLPGVAQTRYCRADVERIAAEAIVPARVDKPMQAPLAEVHTVTSPLRNRA
jgi:hypothetical protein